MLHILPGSTRERVAGFDMVIPAGFVVTHRYSPSWCSWTIEMVRVSLLTPSKLSASAWSGCQPSSSFAIFLSHWNSMGLTPVASIAKVTESLLGMILAALSGFKLIFGGSAVDKLCSIVSALLHLIKWSARIHNHLTNAQCSRIGNNSTSFVRNTASIFSFITSSYTWKDECGSISTFITFCIRH